MDWEIFCDCACRYAVKSGELFGRRGHVTLERPNQIRTKVRDIFRLLSTTKGASRTADTWTTNARNWLPVR